MENVVQIKEECKDGKVKARPEQFMTHRKKAWRSIKKKVDWIVTKDREVDENRELIFI